ncbi:MAG: TonB-dependent receptor plug domain-containing protein [Chitinivibrionales bacterium]
MFFICVSSVSQLLADEGGSGVSDTLVSEIAGDAEGDTAGLFMLDRMVVEEQSLKNRGSEIEFTDSDIKGYYSDLTNLLEGVAGLSVRRTGGKGEYADLSVRGRPSRHTGVYLNGIELNTSAGGAVDISKLPVMSALNVSVLKGGSTFKLAGSGTGALIDISTVSDQEAAENEASGYFEAGSYGQIDAGAFLITRSKGFVNRFNISVNTAENNYPYEHDNGTIYNEEDDYTAEKDHNRYSDLYAAWSGSMNLNGNRRLSVTTDISKYRKEFYIKSLADQNQNVENKGTNITGRLKYESDPEGENYFEAALRGRWRREIFSDPEGQYYIGGEKREEKKFPFVKAEGFFRRRVSETFTLKSKMSLSAEEYVSKNLLIESHEYIPKVMRGTASAGICGNLFPEERLSAGVWYLYTFSYDSTNYERNHGYSIESPSSAIGNYHNANAWVGFKPNELLKTELELSYKSIPLSFDNRYGYGPHWIGNSDLRPEKTLDVSLSTALNIGRIRAGVSLFCGKVRDWISVVGQGQSLLISQNIGDVLNYGTEADLFLPLGSFFTLSYNYHYVNPMILKGRNPDNKGKTIPFFSQHKHNLDLRFNAAFFEIGHRVKYLSPYKTSFSDNAGVVELDPQLTIYSSFDVKDIARLSFRVENYLNESVERELFPNYPLPGRMYFFTANFQF